MFTVIFAFAVSFWDIPVKDFIIMNIYS